MGGVRTGQWRSLREALRDRRGGRVVVPSHSTAALVLVLTACGAAGGGAQPSSTPSLQTPIVSPSPLPPSPTQTPQSTPPPIVRFSATVSRPDGATVRIEPGTDTPDVRVDPLDTVEGFDAWYRRTDSPPVVDAVSGRIERWSRDWFRLADGSGWISSASVRGFQPADLAQLAWVRPSWLRVPQVLELPVAFDHQDYHASCEVAALKMALTVEGIYRSEDQLLDAVGVDRRPPQLDEDGHVVRWGDPEQVFVGDPDGRPSDLTGYGVHVDPIARAARAVGGTVLSAGRDVAAEDIYAALRHGHPVVAWITVDYLPTTLHWFHTFDGATAWYSTLEHAVTLVGISPDAVLVNDPARTLAWHSRAEFEAGYDLLHRMAVILE